MKSEKVEEFFVDLRRAYGSGVVGGNGSCEHVHFFLLVQAVFKRLLRVGRFGRQESETNLLEGIGFFEAGKKHFMEGKNQEALDCFDKAIKNGVEDEVYELRAMCLQALDFHLDAIDDFNKAISLSPENANSYFMRSLSESRTGDVEACISDLESAVRLSKIDNEANRILNEGAKETGRNSVTDFYNSYLFKESNLPLPEALRQKNKEKYSARRKTD
jgi:tetratricopeptide (TPR) repeat protein